VPGNVPKIVGTGNGSPCGIMVYEGDLLPPEYRGAVFEVDAGSRQVNHFPLTRSGAAFRTDYKVLLGSDDRWFRPVDACSAPDGSVFVADWYDAGVGGHSFRDQTSGRIFRVAPKGHKSTKPKPDFGTEPGLIAALKSPNVATVDAARRLLIDQRSPTIGNIAVHETDPIFRARALWVWHAIEGDSAALAMLVPSIGGRDPRIREQVVRMLGQDCRENGHVAYESADGKLPAPALKHLETLLALADDPDAGVRRELILALRNLPTDKVAPALRKLTASWDGTDRWYLEALGLALEKRESRFLAQLFDGTLFGNLEPTGAGNSTKVALPPYFPVDRNEAYIKVGTPELPATAVSKYLGLAWRIHSREVLPLLERLAPYLQTPDLRQAADDILNRMTDPDTADYVAGMATKESDQARRQALTAMLARRLAGDWNPARKNPRIVNFISETMRNPQTQSQGLALAAATGEARYRTTFEKMAQDTKAPEDVRVAAVEALASINITPNRVPEQLVAAVRGKPSSNAVAEAAVRVMARHSGAAGRLTDLLTTPEYPLGLRREAVRSLAQLRDGGTRIIELVKTNKLPEDLRTEATALLHASTDRRVRDEAARVLPLPKTAAGKPLPPIGELIRRDGNADHGRDVFFRAGVSSCGSCHRVQGQGQWIGPDLSTIGIKYGRDELLRSILNPSAAIGFSFRSLIVALDDGRVITGLPIEDAPDRMVLKTATGERITIPTASIEARRNSDVSLMPEGLAQSMTEQDLVDLLVYLTTLRRPVSIVGQYQVLGPLGEMGGKTPIDPAATIDLSAPIDDGHGHKLSWRRLDANTEGIVDLAPFSSIDRASPNQAASAFVFVPIVSPLAQKATLALDTTADVSVWQNGKPLELTGVNPGKTGPRTVTIDLPAGATSLLIRVTPKGASKGEASLVTTLVVDQPVSFSAPETKLSARAPGAP
jgi:putative heme-binding domain-containing protein